MSLEGTSKEDVPPPAKPAAPSVAVPAAAAPTPSPFARNPSFNTGPGVRPMRRPDTPRRLKNGLRLRRREGIELLAWPADAWSTLLLSGIDDTVTAEALVYARAVQAATLLFASAVLLQWPAFAQ
jgi:hypothetical protein